MVVVVGWFIIASLEGLKARDAAGQQLRVEHLLKTYHKLEGIVQRQSKSPENRGDLRGLPEVTRDTQLLGTLDEMALAKQIADELASDRDDPTNVEPLLKELRNLPARRVGIGDFGGGHHIPQSRGSSDSSSCGGGGPMRNVHLRFPSIWSVREAGR